MEMPVACSSPIRARPRTSCAFPSQRGISALNSARAMDGVDHVADASRAAAALRTDETAIPGDDIPVCLQWPPANKETTGNLSPAQHLSFGVIIPYLNVGFTRRRRY